MYTWVYKPFCYYFTGYITGSLFGMLVRLKHLIIKDKYDTKLTGISYNIENDVRRMEVFGFSLGFFGFIAHDYLKYYPCKKQITSEVVNIDTTNQ